MFVVVAVVCGVAMAVVHVIDVVAVRNGDMSTALPVDMVMAFVGEVCRGFAFVVVVTMGAMHMAVVYIVDMIAVGDGNMAATRAVGVFMACMLRVNRC